MPLHAGRIVARKRQVEGGQGGGRPRGADQPSGPRSADLPGQLGLEALADLPMHGLEPRLVDRPGEWKPFGQGNDAQWEAHRRDEGSVDGEDVLGAAAADVEADHRPRHGPEPREDPPQSETRLLLAADDVHPASGRLRDRGREGGAVRGLAHRAGGHNPDLPGAVLDATRDVALDHRARACHGTLPESPGRGQPLAEPGDFLILVDHRPGGIVARVDGEEADGVAAEIDGGEAHAETRTPRPPGQGARADLRAYFFRERM